MAALIVNFAASAPGTIAYASTAPLSGSLAATVVTAVWFSLTLTEAVARPPFEVISGASFRLLTVMARACVSIPPSPSETWTTTS